MEKPTTNVEEAQPDMTATIAALTARVEAIENGNLQNKPDRTVSTKHIQILDARNIQLGQAHGTMIGTQSTQKLGFYGKTPIVQSGAISAPSGGVTVDGAARTAIDSILTVLTNLGLIQ